ncbi:MAG: hypothetical protein GWP08_07040 [Nitrospiraceae bacterium]|nr:hypothetical protein [Nitrospiraceae bacterium]
MNTRLMTLTTLLAVAVSCAAAAAPNKHADADGSRARVVHRIPLYDETGSRIRCDFDDAKPFSPRATCGDCHDYDLIGAGWHFNAADDLVAPGRPGEPWMLIDKATGTQLPLSYRGWPGTWRPADIGMTSWEFTKTFGRHMPGGGVAEGGYLFEYGTTDPAGPGLEEIDPHARWDISGELEINCLTCHNVSSEQNGSEWAFQVARENFRWASTAAAGLGIVNNVASRLPESYDPANGANPDNSYAVPPTVDYDPAKFDAKQRVLFDVVRDAPAERCAFCHSTVSADADLNGLWRCDGDVHMQAANLSCTDCHRNGIGHGIVRGYEGESSDPTVASLTCAGCHSGTDAEGSVGGRLGAPVPLHKGLPESHLDKLTCTLCHSGSKPEDTIGLVRTSRANRLGIHGAAKWDTELPYIVAPVYKRQENGKIAPFNVVWPAFWGVKDGDDVKPLPIDTVTPYVSALRWSEDFANAKAAWAMAQAFAEGVELTLEAEECQGEVADTLTVAEAAFAIVQEQTSGATVNAAALASIAFEGTVDKFNLFIEGIRNSAQKRAAEEAGEPEPEPKFAPKPEVAAWTLDDTRVSHVLAKLQADGVVTGVPVYVSGGKLHSLQGEGTLSAEAHKAAAPYSWPIAHDVRPASEAIGAKGCTECHAPDAPFFFAKVDAATPADLSQAPFSAAMYELQEVDEVTLKALGLSVRFRNLYLTGSVVAGVFLAFGLMYFVFLGLQGAFRAMIPTTGRRK